MGLKERLERHRDLKRFRHIIDGLYGGGFRNYSCRLAYRKMSEAYSIIEKLKGKIPEKKMRLMERAMIELEDEYEGAQLSGYLH